MRAVEQEDTLCPADMQDNRRVVEMLRAGNEACFQSLFRRYYKPLCTYATRFVSLSRAEELVQDTLMWIWENRNSLLPELPLKSLLFTIVKNKALNSASRNSIRNRVMRELAESYEERFDDPDLYVENELMQRLTAALRKMPPEFQQTFRMHRLEGMTHREIAEALHVSPQTVNYRIGQTVRMLREELKDCWPLMLLLFGHDFF
ncbi:MULTISPECIES: RNA polymerase sigma-70 factor [Alistipes]|uniref:RNA polymerase sigma-70 factor n=1 Tax=Alistipes TaxID=239759 RepID=UPI000B56E13E|nr:MULTISPECIES: RNA polymerase sigma-70 factor [Alistipes]OUN58880.1 RNA polymerase subunit sigma-70 [Alistipes sp. An66]